MNGQLVTIGIVCIVAALVGGGLKLAGFEIPGITSRTVQILVGLVGAGAVYLGIYGDSLGGKATTGDDPTSPTATADSGPSTTAQPGGGPPAPAKPLWQGTILLSSRGIDFAADPPELGTVNDISVNVVAYSSSHNVEASPFAGSRLARWTGPAEPTATDCANLLATHGTKDAKFDRQDQFCLQTAPGGRIVAMTFLSQQNDAWEISATVWRSPN